MKARGALPNKDKNTRISRRLFDASDDDADVDLTDAWRLLGKRH